MITQKIKKNKGFVILFAVTLAAIVLSIALGVSEIALKELKFSTSAKDTNDAFFAADTGIEYVLFNDQPEIPSPWQTDPENPSLLSWEEIITGLGSEGASCAIITIEKDNTADPLSTETTITSKGYNVGDASCNWPNPDRIEREIETRY